MKFDFLKAFSPEGIIDNGKKRMHYVEIAYFIGLLLVIFGHSHPLDQEWWFSWYKYSNAFIYTFHMQLYFFIAGYLLVHSKSIDKIGYAKWIKGKLLKFGVPYFVLTAIAYLPKFFIGGTSDNVELGIGYFLKTTFLIPRIGVWGHFWFIAAFITLEIIWGVWRGYAAKNRNVHKYGLIVGFILFLLLAIFPIRTDWFTLYDISQVGIFYTIGIIAGLLKPKLWDTKRKNIINIIIGAVGTYFLYPYGNFMFTQYPIINFIVGFCLVWIVWNLSVLISKMGTISFATKISPYSFSIFIYSWPAQATVEAFTRSMGMTLITSIIVLFCIGFSAPIYIIEIYKKCKFLHCKFMNHLIGIDPTAI